MIYSKISQRHDLNPPAYDIIVDLSRINGIDALERHDRLCFEESLWSYEERLRNVRSNILYTFIPIDIGQRNDPASLPQRLLGLSERLTFADAPVKRHRKS
jgi:hypothetical protein